MCHTHWRQYTNALRKAAVGRKAEASTVAEAQPEPASTEVADEVIAKPEPSATPSRRSRKGAVPETDEEIRPDEG